MPAVATGFLIDGDAAFVRVDNKRPPHMLEPGVVPDAQNQRFDQGQALPRYGIGQQAWGMAGVNFVPTGATYNTLIPGYASYTLNGFVIGQTYQWVPDTQLAFAPSNASMSGLTTVLGTAKQLFVATDTKLVIQAPVLNYNTTVHAQVIRVAPPLGYARFTAPDTSDNGVLVTADWRDGSGEDGGFGRAWRITQGNIPQQIPMNGHDAWDVVRLIACYNGLLMLRGNRNERHYFSAANGGIVMQGPASIPADTFRYRTSNVAGLRIPSHGLSTGMYINVTGVGGTGYNANNVQVTVVDANNITYPNTGSNEGSAGSPVADTTGVFTLVGGPGQINLNCVPSWNDGDLVLFNPATGGSAIYGNQPPAAGAQYYVKSVGGTIGVPPTTNQTVLYLDAACTNPLSITTNNPAPNGNFYLERQAVSPGPYGNGAPTLLMQGLFGQTPFAAGFVAAPASVAITGIVGNTANAPAHRLLPGDAVVVTGLQHSGGALANPCYANPISADQVQFYDTQVHALAASNANQSLAGLITLDGGHTTGTLVKQSASAVPCPPAREGIYYLQRVFLLNGANNIIISDPLDPLHYSPLQSSLTGNLGENQQVTSLQPLGKSTLLVRMPNFILALYNLNQSSANWVLDEVTRQYGTIASLADVHIGTDVWGFGRSGVVSVTKTEFGELSGVDIPVSDTIPRYINQVDWPYAAQACGENWNNRTFFAVPLKGQTGARVNNAVLVFNGLNKFLAVQQAVEGDELVGETVATGERPDAWEGVWTGPNLQPVDFARLIVNGEERLTWVNANGLVCWFTDDFTDMGAAIATSLTPRAYFTGRRVLALVSEINWDTFNPSISINIQSPGWAESQVVTANFGYDRTKYLVAGKSDLDFSQPGRADYSMIPDQGLYTPGVPFDVHQNITEKFRHRVRDRNVQLVIANAQGSCRINSVVMKAMPTTSTASRET